MRTALAGGLFSVLLMASTAHATANIALGATVVANSTSVGYGDGGNPAAIVDGVKGDSVVGSGVSYWIGTDGTTTGFVTIDLGGSYNITGFTLTDTHNGINYDRGTNAFAVGVGSSAAAALTNAQGGSAAATGAFSVAQWQNLTDVSLEASATGRYVTFYGSSVYSNQPGDSTGNGSTFWPTESIGLSELQVFGTLANIVSPVPEPISMALLGTGLVGLLAMRRRSI